nr:hypothetical protein [Tanacetum cinerariifolium]
MGSPKLPSSGMELNLLNMAAMDLHQPKSLLALLLQKPTMLKPPAYSTVGYAQPLYDAQQPPAYEGSYGGGYQPRAYSSDICIALVCILIMVIIIQSFLDKDNGYADGLLHACDEDVGSCISMVGLRNGAAWCIRMKDTQSMDKFLDFNFTISLLAKKIKNLHNKRAICKPIIQTPPAHNMNSHSVKMNWRELFPSITDSEHWHQSLKPGKHRNTLSQMEFMRRKIKRGKEDFAPCARQITKECKAMPRNKIEQINLFNSTLSSRKFRKYTCFYCTQTGHVAKSCLTKLDDEQLYAQAGAITFRHGDEATRARIRKNKESVKCFKCQGSGHFANACPQDNTETMQKQEKETTATIPSLPGPKVSIKYAEFIHFRTRGIIDGTDKGS